MINLRYEQCIFCHICGTKCPICKNTEILQTKKANIIKGYITTFAGMVFASKFYQYLNYGGTDGASHGHVSQLFHKKNVHVNYDCIFSFYEKSSINLCY